MNGIEVSTVDLVEGGDIFKQGHYLTLGYIPRDENGNAVDLSGKNITVSLWERKGIAFESGATFSGGVLRFTLNETVPAGNYQIEFTATSSTDDKFRKKFPTNYNSGRISVQQSADDAGNLGISVYTVAQIKSEQQSAQVAYQEEINPKISTLTQRVDDGVGAFTEDTEIIDARMGKTNLRQFNEGLTAQLADIAVSVKSFGAIGDGVTDDTASIQSAFDNANNLYFPPGRYLVNGFLTIGSNTTLMGIKNQSIIIRDFFTTSLIEPIIKASGKENIHLAGLSFERKNNRGATISLNACSHFSVYDCSINGERLDGVGCIGFEFRECHYGLVKNNYTNGTRGHALTIGTATLEPLGGCSNIIVEGNIFENYGVGESYGMALDLSGGYKGDVVYPCKNISIVNNTFRGGDGNGCKLQIVEDVIFSGNIIGEHPNAAAIILNGQSTLLKNIKVSNNKISVADVGIWIVNAGKIGDYIEISNNEIIEVITMGIQTSVPQSADYAKVLISNNRIESLSHGIYSLPSRSVIENNHIQYDQGKGIAIEGRSDQEMVEIIIRNNTMKGGVSTPINIAKSGITIDRVIIEHNVIESNTSGMGIYAVGDSVNVININKLFINNNKFEMPNLDRMVWFRYTTTATGKIENNFSEFKTTANLLVSVHSSVVLWNNRVKGDNHSGNSTARPVYPSVGQAFFDTTLGKPIFCKATGASNVWVDGSGAIV